MSPELSDYEFADGHSNLRKKPSRNVSAKSSGGHESHRSEPPVKKLVSIVSVNSVTDERYIEAQSESSQCQQHKQKMISSSIAACVQCLLLFHAPTSQKAFLYFAVAAPGKVNDARAFGRCNGLLRWLEALPDLYHILGDGAYPLSSKALIPFSGAEANEDYKRTYNYYLSQLRIQIQIEMVFGRL